MTAVLEQHTVLPPTEHADELAELHAVLNRPRLGQAELIGPDGARVPLPDEVYQVLRQVVTALNQGLAITVAPHNTLLTTQQAADLLSISRPTLVKLLEQGDIPFEMRGRHRRVLLADLLAYQRTAKANRHQILDDMTREAEADGLTGVVEAFGDTD